MMLSTTLYSTNSSLVSHDIIRSCLGLFDFTKLRVSRTIGPENYYEVERRYLDTGASKSPPEDISYQEFTEVEEVCALIRSGSVLRISVASNSERWGEITRGISNYSQGTSVFFSSTTGFSFGPLDICDYFEDRDGQDNVRLIDVAQFSYFLTSQLRGRLGCFTRKLGKGGSICQIPYGFGAHRRPVDASRRCLRW